ncbi:GntR family transcriptional regulator [Spirillospora sp. CA-255316]
MSTDPLIDALYELIRNGELSPGQRVDQRMVADRLDVSRTPLREALRALAAHGILTRTPNQGYAVVKLSAADLLQYYSLRTFLETEVLRSIEWPDHAHLDEMRELNDECRRAVADGSADKAFVANYRFHFLMYSWSPQRVLKAEIERVWRVTDPYRRIHGSSADTRQRMIEDHDRMIEAIERRDGEQLIILMDSHRGATQRILQELLPPAPNPALLLPQSAPRVTR